MATHEIRNTAARDGGCGRQGSKDLAQEKEIISPPHAAGSPAGDPVGLRSSLLFRDGKLVAGRTVRKYTSEAEVIKATTEAGYTDIYKTTLLGVGDLEKRLGRKKFSEVLGRYIVKPQGAPTLVPETDPHKPYSDAAGDFKE